MPATRCIVRAYADEPLDREALAYERNLIFIAKSANVDSVDNVEKAGAIGFPEECVFEFDGALFDRLLKAYQGQKSTLQELWNMATPLRATLPRLMRER